MLISTSCFTMTAWSQTVLVITVFCLCGVFDLTQKPDLLIVSCIMGNKLEDDALSEACS